MTKWVLDTNVLSELRRKNPDRAVMRWMKTAALEALHTTSVNIAELRIGISSQASAIEAHRLTIWLEDSIRPMFQNRILQPDEGALFIWRTLARQLELKRLPAPAVDLLIAAIALQNGAAVVTRDTKPFVGTGVAVCNPWTGERFNGA